MIQSSNEHDSSFTKSSYQNASADASSHLPKDSAAHYNAATLAFATQVVIDCGVPQMLQLPGIDHDEHNLAYESGARIDKVVSKPVPTALPVTPANVETKPPEASVNKARTPLTTPIAKRTLNRIAPRAGSKSLLCKHRLMAKRDEFASHDSTAAESTEIPATKPIAVASIQSAADTQQLAKVAAPKSPKRTVAPTPDTANETNCPADLNTVKMPATHKAALKDRSTPRSANAAASDAAALLALAVATSAAKTERSHQKTDRKRARIAAARLSPMVPAALIFPETNATEGFLATAVTKPTSEGKSAKSAKGKLKGAAVAASIASVAAVPKAAEAQQEELDFSSATSTFSVAEPEPQEEECYTDWFERVVVKNRWATWFTTFYVHWLLLLALTVIIVHGPEKAANLLINATMASVDEFETPAFEVDVSGPAPQTEPEPVAEPVKVNEFKIEEKEVQLSESLLDQLSPNGDIPAASESSSSADAEPKPTKRALNPAPASAISEGSFSVWTEPTYPVAGVPYRIIIQVCLPDGIQRYNIADLEGVVVGSDGYRKPIPGSLRGFLPVENGYGRLIIPIVSADATVKDTVYIRSKLLKEAQKLLIEF